MDTAAHPPESLEPTSDDYNLLVHFRRHKVEPPSDLYLTLDDVILFQGWAALATTNVRVSIRMLTTRGEIIPEFFTVAVAANGTTQTTKLITNLEGYMLSMSAELLTGLAGSVWVNVVVQRGTGTNDATQGLNILQGYPSLTDTLSWPQAPPWKSIDGRALANVVTVGNPAPAADYAITVPAGVNWLLRSIHYQLVTSAAVANRFSVLLLQDNLGNTFAQIPGGPAQAASLTFQYTFANGLQVSSQNNVQTTGLPTEARLPGGFQIKTLTAAIQAADQYSGMALELETFIAQ